MKIAIYHRQLEPQAQSQLARLTAALESRGVVMENINSQFSILNSQLVLSVGGDGTLLSAVHLLGDSGIPVLGVNYGHLGFLTTVGQEVEPEAFVEDLLAGRYTIEERTLLHCPLGTALNEITLRRETAALLRISLYVDDQFVATYEGDGVIVATPTGSTAYNLSCGGPILTPDSGCFVVTPIGAHNLTLRPMIVPDSARLRLESHGGSYSLGIDSQSLQGTTPITLGRAPYTVRLARMHNQSFFTAMHEKLAWGTELR